MYANNSDIFISFHWLLLLSVNHFIYIDPNMDGCIIQATHNLERNIYSIAAMLCKAAMLYNIAGLLQKIVSW